MTTFVPNPFMPSKTLSIPAYIAVEGPIGIGKTTLARRLAETFKVETLLELASENPFLERFYDDRKSQALPTQLYFLFQRIEQLQALRQGDIFQQVRICDFLMDKDPLFAQINLDDNEYQLYQTIYNSVMIDLPKPDLVVYLQAPTEVLYDRINRRGRSNERGMDKAYLEKVNDAYTTFFYHYSDTPLLIVNTANINLVDNDTHYQNLVRQIANTHNGRHYYNPQSAR
jgi:deoxyadenosine/deoxycytidine kinase